MQVTVKLYGLLRFRYPDYEPEKGMRVCADDGITILELIEKIGFRREEVGLILYNGRITDDIGLAVAKDSTVEFCSVIPHGG